MSTSSEGSTGQFVHLPAVSPVEVESPRFHDTFNFRGGDVAFLIENTIFKVHEYFFYRDSPVFRDLVSAIEKFTVDSPIALDGIKSIDFERFLRVLYPLVFNAHDATAVEEWISILGVADRLDFKSIRELAVEQLTPIASPVDKVVLGRQYGISEWLRSAYDDICSRKDSLTLEEALRLGPEEFVKISTVRQAMRPYTNFIPIEEQVSLIDQTFNLNNNPIPHSVPSEQKCDNKVPEKNGQSQASLVKKVILDEYIKACQDRDYRKSIAEEAYQNSADERKSCVVKCAQQEETVKNARAALERLVRHEAPIEEIISARTTVDVASKALEESFAQRKQSVTAFEKSVEDKSRAEEDSRLACDKKAKYEETCAAEALAAAIARHERACSQIAECNQIRDESEAQKISASLELERARAESAKLELERAQVDEMEKARNEAMELQLENERVEGIESMQIKVKKKKRPVGQVSPIPPAV